MNADVSTGDEHQLLLK